MLRVLWSAFSDQGIAWYLNTTPLNVDVKGVYIVWKPAANLFKSRVVIKVGHGDIAQQLSRLKKDSMIEKYGDSLKVTWAVVPEFFLQGVERYLTEKYQPLEIESFIHAQPVSLNLPI